MNSDAYRRQAEHLFQIHPLSRISHYGFTDEELDFIINYDIKYRMGRELDGDNS